MSNKVIGNCNICGCYAQLSEDHVPPKCCSNKGNVKFYALFDRNFQPTKKPKQAQNGIKFKTICSACNNERLGKELDPFLGEMQNEIVDMCSNFTSLSDGGILNVCINKVTRCVIGHMLAAFPHYINTTFENSLRGYFFNKTKKSITGQHLYLWINFEKRVAIARNVGIALDADFNGAMISLLKFPGAAFMLCDKQIDDHMIDLFDYTTDNWDDYVNIPINMDSIISNRGEVKTTEWPLIENDSRLFVLSQDRKHLPIFSTFLDV